ncbi:MAG: hypothetical protein HKN87_23005 [Saprospiraceae bacterium]|nr:hypothetical protein [Saprospiraceae bacterium]
MKLLSLSSFVLFVSYAQATPSDAYTDSSGYWQIDQEIIVPSQNDDLHNLHLYSTGCPTEVFFHNMVPISQGTHEALELISASDKVTSGSVIFRAGQEISLEATMNSGFEVALGATFEATIGPCTL